MTIIKQINGSLQREVGALFLLLAIAFNIASYVAMQYLVYPAFTQLEQDVAAGELDRVRQLLDSELDSLEVFSKEYSDWTETWNFLLGKSPSYVEEQVYPQTWRDANLDAMVFIDRAGKLVWGQIQDPATRAILPDDLVAFAQAGKELSTDIMRLKIKSGFVNLPRGILLLVGSPVLQTDSSGPPAGAIIIGRYISDKRLQDYKLRIGVEFSLQPMDLSQMADLAPENKSDGYIPDEPVNFDYQKDYIVSSTVWRDVFNQRTLAVGLHTTREVSSLGSEISAISIGFLATLSAAFILIAWLLMRNLVVRPISHLKSNISAVRETGNLSLGVDLYRADEIGGLADEFTMMKGELKAAHANLETARDEALSSARMKSDFLASMSHEIRTPMNGVIGMTDLLLKTDLSDSQLRLVDTVKTSAKTLLLIINDILDFSKMNAGKLQIREGSFSLHQLVKDVSAVVAEPAQRKGLEYISFESPGLPRNVIGDDLRIRQVLINLLSNAIKFTERGEVVLTAECIRTWCKDDVERAFLKFTVRDTGIGIDKSAKEKVFSAFSQEDSSTTRTFGGTGLGLSISKELVELMGGKIDFESVKGEGAEFWFTLSLPLDRSADERGSDYQFNMDKLRGLKVMVVDDNATNREVLLSYMESCGAHADVFSGAAEALQGLRQAADQGWHYDLLILDYHMPNMDGLILSETVSDTTAFGQPATIILSSLADEFSSQELLTRGVSRYLTKPIMQDELYRQAYLALISGDAAEIQQSAFSTPDQENDDCGKLHADVLVAEDNAVNQQLVKILLEDCGCNFVLVENGEQVLAELKSRSFDLVLMDCQMPVMDGFEAASIIRERGIESKHGGQLPILAVTANALEGDRERCIAAGMEGYLTKPFDSLDLMNSMRSLLRTPVNPGCIDGDALERIRSMQREGRPSVLNRLIDVYLDTSPTLVAELEKAVSSNDATAVELNAHTLKSSSANLGAHKFASLCEEVEQKGRAVCLEDVVVLVKKLKNEFIRVCEALIMERQEEC